jgi:hypothetical protein
MSKRQRQKQQVLLIAEKNHESLRPSGRCVASVFACILLYIQILVTAISVIGTFISKTLSLATPKKKGVHPYHVIEHLTP